MLSERALAKENLQLQMMRAARADTVEIDRSFGGYRVKFVRTYPHRVGYNFDADDDDMLHHDRMVEMARRVGKELDKLQDERMKKEKATHSEVTMEKEEIVWDKATIEKKGVVYDEASEWDGDELRDLREVMGRKLEAERDAAMMRELEALEVLMGAKPDTPAPAPATTTTDKFEQIVKGIAAANMVCILSTKGQTFAAEFDARALAETYDKMVDLEADLELTFDRVAFHGLKRAVYVTVVGPDGVRYLIDPRDMDDLLPELSLMVDQAVAENSEFGSLVKLNAAVRTITDGKPAIARALTEEVTRVMVAVVGKIEESKKEASQDHYQRQAAFGMI